MLFGSRLLAARIPDAALLVPRAHAQSAVSTGMGNMQAGYGASRYTTSRPQTGSTRDINGNLVVVDGQIQAGAAGSVFASGVSPASSPAPAGSARSVGGSAPSATT